MSELKRSIIVGKHSFELVDGRYECRGAMYHDDDHDQVPEPSLQLAAAELQSRLKKEGVNTQLEWGEKGWIEVYIED
jgi:hypothetical protein